MNCFRQGVVCVALLCEVATSLNADDSTLSLLKVKQFPEISTGIQATVADAHFIYVADRIAVTQVDPKGMVVRSKATLSGFDQNAALAVDDSHVYVASRGKGSTGALIRLNKSPLSMEKAIVLPRTDGTVYSLLVDNTHLYCGTYTFPAKIIKLDKSSMRKVQEITLQEGMNDVRTLVGDPTDEADEYLYAMTNTAPGQVVKIRKTTMAVEKVAVLKAGENNLLAGTLVDSQHVYVASSDTPGTIVKLHKGTLARLASYTLEGAGFITSMVADEFSLFAVTYTMPSLVVQVLKKGMTKQTAIMLQGPHSMLSKSSAVSVSGKYLFVGTDTSPAYMCMLGGYGQSADSTETDTTSTPLSSQEMAALNLPSARLPPPTPSPTFFKPAGCLYRPWTMWTVCKQKQDGASTACDAEQLRVQQPDTSNGANGCKMQMQRRRCQLSMVKCKSPTPAPTATSNLRAKVPQSQWTTVAMQQPAAVAVPVPVRMAASVAASVAAAVPASGVGKGAGGGFNEGAWERARLPPTGSTLLQEKEMQLQMQLAAIKREEHFVRIKRAAPRVATTNLRPTSSKLNGLTAPQSQPAHISTSTAGVKPFNANEAGAAVLGLGADLAPSNQFPAAAPAVAVAKTTLSLNSNPRLGRPPQFSKAAIQEALREQARHTEQLRQKMQRKKMQLQLGSTCSSIYCFIDKKGRMVTSTKKKAEANGNRHKCLVSKLDGACECKCWDERRLATKTHATKTQTAKEQQAVKGEVSGGAAVQYVKGDGIPSAVAWEERDDDFVG
jgi:hypothetical protein